MAERIDDKPSSRVLDPIDRNSEILFGLFMVLTFTGTLSVATAGREDVREMLIAAIGCNIAWGFVDGVMYVLRNLVVRARQARVAREVRDAVQPEQAHRIIADEIGKLSGAMGATELERVRRWIVEQPGLDVNVARMTLTDLRGAIGVFLLVFASTLPVVLPFVLFSDLYTAMRVSALIAISMLYLCGYSWGRYGGLPKPWRTGLVMVLLGVMVEAIVIALGG